jgi:PAS domain S-box-containing protein
MATSRSRHEALHWDVDSVMASFIDDNPGSIFAMDREARILSMNEALCRLTGRNAAELAGIPIADLVASAVPGWSEQVVDLALSGAQQHYSVILQGAAGAIPALLMVFPERGGHDTIAAYGYIAGRELRGPIEDQLRGLLQATQAGLSAIFESGATGIIFFDVHGQIIDTNPALQKLLAYDAATLRTMNIIDLVHESDRLTPNQQGDDPFVELVTGSRDHYDAMRRYMHHDGHLIWAQVTVSAVRDDLGEIQYFISIMQDVTEHRLLEDVAVIANDAGTPHTEALLRIVEQLALQLGFKAGHVYLVNEQTGRVLPSGIWYLESPGLMSNFRALTDLTSFAPGSGLVGRVFRDRSATLVTNLFESRESVRVAAARDDGVRTGLFVPMIVHNNIVGVIEFYSLEDRQVDPAMLRMLTRTAPHLGWLVERERAREAAERQNVELARSNRDLERFASIASHDLQEPLRAIGRSAQLLHRRYAELFDENAGQLFHFIVDGVQRMESLIDDLLRYSRISARTAQFELVDLNEVVDDVCRDLSAAMDDCGATITAGDLPVVFGNQSQLYQVFQNLFANALKYRGQAPPQIRVGVQPLRASWLISVMDNGIGIAPAYHEQIFELFRRLHPRDRYTGTGIGLAIVKRIIEQHDGRIWVESDEGQGATFFITLPVPGEEIEQHVGQDTHSSSATG